MSKRSRTSRQPPRDEPPDIFELFADQLAKGGGIDRLLLFGEPAASDHGDISAGEFVSDPRVERWLVAIEKAEEGDKSALVNLMKSDSIPNKIVPCIGELIENYYHFKKPAHKPRTPLHRMTAVEIAMNAADCEVDDLVSAGKSLSDALAEVVAKHEARIRTEIALGLRTEEEGIGKLTISKLREFHAKRRGPERRAKARSYDAKRRTKRRAKAPSAGK